MIYLIIFELSQGEKHYEELFAKIKAIGKWSRPFENCFLVKAVDSASQIYFNLKPHIDKSDNLLVLQAGKDWFGFLPMDKLSQLQEMLD